LPKRIFSVAVAVAWGSIWSAALRRRFWAAASGDEAPHAKLDGFMYSSRGANLCDCAKEFENFVEVESGGL
jgi:hypothetical protein